MRTGKELISDFFKNLHRTESPSLDRKTVEILVNLFEQNKLTNTNIANELTQARETSRNEVNEINVSKDKIN